MEPTKISVAEAMALFETGSAVFADARNAYDWTNSDEHIPGAIRVPPDEAELHLNEIPRDRTIVQIPHAGGCRKYDK